MTSRVRQREQAGMLVAGHGRIVAEFFDTGQSRMLPWAWRPQTAALVAALADPDRGWDAIVIGGYEWAFYGSQYASMAPLFQHYGIQLWAPELGGRIDFHAEDHEETMLALADLELRHRRRARCEDRIRCAKDTGLRNLPLHGYAQNQIWCEITALACELIAWTQMLALDGPARRWEPKRLRLRLFSTAAQLARGGRRLRLRLAATWPWAGQLTTAITRLQDFPSG